MTDQNWEIIYEGMCFSNRLEKICENYEQTNDANTFISELTNVKEGPVQGLANLVNPYLPTIGKLIGKLVSLIQLALQSGNLPPEKKQQAEDVIRVLQAFNSQGKQISIDPNTGKTLN